MRSARLLVFASLSLGGVHAAPPIDRRTVCQRHNPRVLAPTAADLDTFNDTFSVGNGAFVFNADITSLQSFNASWTHLGVNTLADWGWHTQPAADTDPTLALRDYQFTFYETPTDGIGGTRSVPYANSGNGSASASSWLMSNPHRLNLGQMSLRLTNGAASAWGSTFALELNSISEASQELDIWEGTLSSTLTISPPVPTTCALVPDNYDVSFSCGEGGVITSVPWASYGRPSGSCATGFVADVACNAVNTTAVVEANCLGRSDCSFHVDYHAGWGDPCRGKPKRFAGNVTCARAVDGITPLPLVVSVSTTVDPDVDMVSTTVSCPAPSSTCTLALRLAFPYGTTSRSGADWSSDSRHTTTLVHNASGGADGRGSVTLLRVLDSDSYRVDCAWDGGLTLLRVAGLAHAFDLVPGGNASAAWPQAGASVSCLYTPVGEDGTLHYPVGEWMPWLAAKANLTRLLLREDVTLPLFPVISAAARIAWQAYWMQGAFIDFASTNDDPLAFELERRVILSQYLMRVNDAGAEPPQETGLLCNSWGGKHHNEMRFWHLAHWAMWGRPELLARSDGFFFDQLQNATSFATMQGYPGARWPKETAAVANRSGIDVPWLSLDHAPWPFGGTPNGTLLVWESAEVANALVMWQLPHVIWLADLQRRAANASSGVAAALAVVNTQAPLVFATADYLAARLFFNETAGHYRIGPPVMGGQESGNVTRTFDPVFELVYVGLVLDIANEWRAWMGLAPSASYAAVASSLAPLHVDPASPPGAPVYTFDAGCVCQFLVGGERNASCKPEWVPPGGSNCAALADHPLQLGVLGMINGRAHGDRYGVDEATTNNTLAAVWQNWHAWRGAWGWDDSLLASSMARLGWDARAIIEGPLMDPKFPYYKNGHTLCCPTYLPANGALLLSISGLVRGFEGGRSPPMHFPPEWGVVAEGFVMPYP